MTALTHMFKPRSIAVIGASNEPARIGGKPVDYLKRYYSGEIYPVNPNRETVQDLKAYPSIKDVDAEVDLALIALPAAAVNGALKECIEKGIDACVILTSGFAEEGEEGRKLQEEVLATARAGGVRLMGPNCIGVGNNQLGSWVTFASGAENLPAQGKLSIITQSGGFASYCLMILRRRGIGLNQWITLGNQVDVDFADCVDFLADDPETSVIFGYLEGITEGEKLAAALQKARRNRKYVILVKVGSSEAGAIATASHTATLAGEDAVYDAVLRQYGAYRAETIEEAFTVAYTCLNAPSLPKSRRTGLVTVSGGLGVLMADAATRHGLDVTALPDSVQDKLKKFLPYSNVRNPVDITAQLVNDFSLVEKTLDALYSERHCDIVVNYQMGVDFTPMRPKMAAVLEDFRKKQPEALVALIMLTNEEIREGYEKQGYLIYEEPSEPFKALAGLCFFAESFEKDAADADSPARKALPAPDLPAGRATLDERKSKAVLAGFGLPVPEETLVQDAEAAAAAAEKIGGAVALKLVSPDVLHKSDIGGVELGVTGGDDARTAYERIVAAAETHAPSAKVEGVLVTPMVADGLEISLGIQNDPVFGPVVMAGLGGVFIEVLKDVSFRKAPVSHRDAEEMLDELRGRKVLDGARGKPAADIPALVETIVKLSDFAVAAGERIESVDVNPLLVLPKGQGAVAVDAVIELRD